MNGDHTPLYQARSMIGGLQLYELRREVVGGGRMGEKEIHDLVLREYEMPINLLRSWWRGES